MKHSNAAVDDSELSVVMEVSDDARHYPGDIEDVQDGDGHKSGGEQTPEVSGLPVPDDDDQEEDVEEDGEEGEGGPGDPVPCLAGDHLDQYEYDP